ncbi:MAG TPA: histone deacetylase [Candidatus Lokiarchaeia archaeon]|nr:histone deacetylase [Candidatus Lokiarchaeia archaeon]
MVTGIIYSDEYLKHVTGTHVESPQRLIATTDLLKERGIWEGNPKYAMIEPRAATIDQILTVHSEQLVQTVQEIVSKAGNNGRLMNIDGDTVVCGDSFDIALLAAGGILEGADQILAGNIENGFGLVRPPGHHSNQNYARGFCVFNNVAIALHYLVTQKGMGKVAIVDWDCHHGNGTQDIFFDGIPGTEEGEMIYISTHQDGRTLYPGSGFINEIGRGRGEGHIINIPLAPKTTDDAVREVYDEITIPILEEFAPDFILVSAGFDPHFSDPITNLGWSSQWFGEMLGKIKDVADKICQGRLLVTLEGGYELKAISRSIVNCLEVLAGDDCTEIDENNPKTDPEIMEYTEQNIIKGLKAKLANYWHF